MYFNIAFAFMELCKLVRFSLSGSHIDIEMKAEINFGDQLIHVWLGFDLEKIKIELSFLSYDRYKPYSRTISAHFWVQTTLQLLITQNYYSMWSNQASAEKYCKYQPLHFSNNSNTKCHIISNNYLHLLHVLQVVSYYCTTLCYIALSLLLLESYCNAILKNHTI